MPREPEARAAKPRLAKSSILMGTPRLAYILRWARERQVVGDMGAFTTTSQKKTIECQCYRFFMVFLIAKGWHWCLAS